MTPSRAEAPSDMTKSKTTTTTTSLDALTGRGPVGHKVDTMRLLVLCLDALTGRGPVGLALITSTECCSRS